jgi:DNA-binding transcriptional ArsR family regulator
MNNETLAIDRTARVLKALGHPSRLRLVRLLISDPCSVNRLTELLAISQSSVSQHLAVLKNAGILEPGRQGSTTCYRLALPAVARLLEILLPAGGEP